MAREFEDCISKNKLIKIPPDPAIAGAELVESEHDLASARDDLKLKNWKWATDKAYYSMFHAARGILLMKGYKEQSHACLIIAVHELFINEGILERKFLDFLISGKKRREDAIYASTYSEEIARAHIEAAREFISAAKALIRKER